MVRLFNLLSFLAGVASTVVGSWIASKIRVYHDSRKAHLEEIKEKAFTPLLHGMKQWLEPLVSNQAVLVQEVWGTVETNPAAKLTESTQRSGGVLRCSNPCEEIESVLEQVLFEDSRRHHYGDLIEGWLSFKSSWNEFARGYEEWVQGMARRIRTLSGLPQVKEHFDPPYVIENPLAVFVQMRLFQLPTGQLRAEARGGYWVVAGSSSEYAKGTEDQMKSLLRGLDEVMEGERKQSMQFREKLDDLRARFQNLSREISYAIRSQRLPGRCRLVKFF